MGLAARGGWTVCDTPALLVTDYPSFRPPSIQYATCVCHCSSTCKVLPKIQHITPRKAPVEVSADSEETRTMRTVGRGAGKGLRRTQGEWGGAQVLCVDVQLLDLISHFPSIWSGLIGDQIRVGGNGWCDLKVVLHDLLAFMMAYLHNYFKLISQFFCSTIQSNNHCHICILLISSSLMIYIYY